MSSFLSTKQWTYKYELLVSYFLEVNSATNKYEPSESPFL